MVEGPGTMEEGMGGTWDNGVTPYVDLFLIIINIKTF